MENKLITILTPTYNRAHLLPKLYESLLNQTNFNFEWLIVDDGSTDNTKEVVNTFINNKFSVKYIYKENGGKHTAVNVGVSNINSILTFIVDSDDWLLENAVNEIEDYYLQYKDHNDLAGFSFLRQYPDGKINVSTGSRTPYIATYFDARVKARRVGDMAEVYYTNILKAYPFPVYENEKFIGEDIVWLEISKKYSLLFIENPIYVSNYLEEGLTKNRRRLTLNNSRGCYEIAIIMLSFSGLNFKLKIKSVIQSIVFGKIKRYKFIKIIKDNKNIFLSLICIPLSFYFYMKWKKDK